MFNAKERNRYSYPFISCLGILLLLFASEHWTVNVVHFPCFKSTSLLPHHCGSEWFVFHSFSFRQTNGHKPKQRQWSFILSIAKSMYSEFRMKFDYLQKNKSKRNKIFRYFVANMLTAIIIISNDHSFSVCLYFPVSSRVNYFYYWIFPFG